VHLVIAEKVLAGCYSFVVVLISSWSLTSGDWRIGEWANERMVSRQLPGVQILKRDLEIVVGIHAALRH